MNTLLHKVEIEIVLKPIWHQDPPVIAVGLDKLGPKQELGKLQRFSFSTVAKDLCTLMVEFYNKTDNDTVTELGLDKAVVIESVRIFGIEDPRFVWKGNYQPIYPEPWASEQKQQGNALDLVLPGHNYLSWNGSWSLQIDVPVFTWIHRVQNLGWIYH
jgi:hypothetical protein